LTPEKREAQPQVGSLGAGIPARRSRDEIIASSAGTMQHSFSQHKELAHLQLI